MGFEWYDRTSPSGRSTFWENLPFFELPQPFLLEKISGLYIHQKVKIFQVLRIYSQSCLKSLFFVACYFLSQELEWKRDNWPVRIWISTKNEEFIYFASTEDFGERKYSTNSNLANCGGMVKRKNLSNIVSRKSLILENLGKKKHFWRILKHP